MPLLDVSELLTDPDFSDTIVLVRRSATVGNNGRLTAAVATETTMVAIVQPVGEDLVLTEESSRVSRFIEIICRERLRTIHDGAVADIVRWQGQDYQVKSVADWSRWGAGFSESVAELLAVSGGA